jgi:hypothetical protein
VQNKSIYQSAKSAPNMQKRNVAPTCSLHVKLFVRSAHHRLFAEHTKLRVHKNIWAAWLNAKISCFVF